MATELFDKFDVAPVTPNAAEAARRYVSPHSVDSALFDHCADFDAAKARLAEIGTPDAEAAFHDAYQRILQHPVQTAAGLQTKLAVMLLAHPELQDDYPDIVATLSSDLGKLA